MSQIDILLARLEKPRRTGPKSYRACCPAHGGKHPNLSITETDDDAILLKCFSHGCTAAEIVASIGLELHDLFPHRQHHGKPERRPFLAADALRAVGYEALVVVAAGKALLAGEPFSPADRERLLLAVERIQAAVSAVMPTMKGARHV